MSTSPYPLNVFFKEPLLKSTLTIIECQMLKKIKNISKTRIRKNLPTLINKGYILLAMLSLTLAKMTLHDPHAKGVTR